MYSRFTRLYVTFIDKDGTEVKLAVCEGDNLLDIAQAHDLEMEGESAPLSYLRPLLRFPAAVSAFFRRPDSSDF
jgi:hypothetical protein